LNFLSRAPLRPIAVALWEQIQNAVMIGVLEVVPLTEELFAEGLALFLSRPDKEWSLTDCISFVVMQNRGIRQAFTADRHFVGSANIVNDAKGRGGQSPPAFSGAFYAPLLTSLTTCSPPFRSSRF